MCSVLDKIIWQHLGTTIGIEVYSNTSIQYTLHTATNAFYTYDFLSVFL